MEPVSAPAVDDSVRVEALDVSSSAPAEKVARYKEGIIRNEEKVTFGVKRHSFDRITTTSSPLSTTQITHHSDPLSLSESRQQHRSEVTAALVPDASPGTTPGPVYVTSPPTDMISPWTTTSISVVTTAVPSVKTPDAEESPEKQISRRSSPVETLDSIEISFGQRNIDKKVGLVKEAL